ncbi:lysin A [Mycobacterium phage MosMoris]|uniref:Lysin A n=1 Tax=Mycobacterium phage MosMoris TaxID=1471542 RepID=A0A023ZWD2_9CAUD|nr:endolysin [Mycobacterium phage MosMoris]AHY84126.1 lysin A [Mycobacterium phage MosMoris]
MSFIRSAFADKPLLTREQWMKLFIRVADELDMPDRRGAAVLAAMCAFQEAGADPHNTGKRQIWVPGNDADPCFKANPAAYPHDSMGDDGQSTGPFQQQMNKPGTTPWGWGGNYGDPEGTRKRMDPYESTKMFMGHPSSGLKKKGYDASNAQTANDAIQRVQGSGVPWAYAQWWDEANLLYDEVVGDVPPSTGGGKVPVSGDPVWLEEVLRKRLGDRLVVHDGWKEYGTGGVMGEIWGVMIHHTGNRNASWESIRNGRPDLRGPLSQALIAPDGKFHLVAVGPCNHAGVGSYPGLGSDGNRRAIGFECAWPTIRPDGSFDKGERWPDAQILTMRDATRAVLEHLGHDHTHVCGHKEFNKVDGKWDPGNMDMNWFRGEVRKALAGEFDPKAPEPEPQLPSQPGIPTDHDLLVYDQICGRWEMLGWRTPVEALATILDELRGTKNAGSRGFTRGPHDIEDKK